MVLGQIEKVHQTLKTMFEHIPKHLTVIFSTLFSVFRNVVKNGLLCLIYYITHSPSWELGCWLSASRLIPSPVADTASAHALLKLYLYLNRVPFAFWFPRESKP